MTATRETFVKQGILLEAFSELKQVPSRDYKYFLEQLPNFSFHCMILNVVSDLEDKESIAEIYHSVPGHKLKGVKSNDLLKDKVVTDKGRSFSLGQLLVINFKNPKINEELTRVGARWAKETPVDLRKALGLKIQASQSDVDLALKKHPEAIELATPYAKRKEDLDEKLQPLFETFRAFRARWRNAQYPPLPLSKKKGTSCSNFLFMSLKVAIINTYFPREILTEINKILYEINNIKIKQKITSLSKLKTTTSELNAFEKLFKMVIDFAKTPKHNESKEDFDLRKKFLALLHVSVKGFMIDHCMRGILEAEIIDKIGFLYFNKNKAVDTAAIMDYTTLQKLITLQNEAYNPIVLTEETLAKLNPTSEKGDKKHSSLASERKNISKP